MGLFTKYKKQTDEQLMILLQKGDHRAFDYLYDRYSQRLNGFFFKMLWSDREMAEDHVQDLFTKLIDKPELYKAGNEVKPWLFKIASNMCKNAYRKRSFENMYREQLQDKDIYISGVERKIDEAIQYDLLSQALTKLDEDRRSMFLLRYQQELSIKQIAGIFDLPNGTVKSRLFYVKNLLAGAIEDDDKK